MSQYSEKVVQYFLNPVNVGSIEDADGVGEVGNPRCGDVMKIYLKIDGESGSRTSASRPSAAPPPSPPAPW
jgi:NifU-like protein involved in Fe-S cluster formation